MATITRSALWDALGQHLFERYIDIKTKECDQFKKQVAGWEIQSTWIFSKLLGWLF